MNESTKGTKVDLIDEIVTEIARDTNWQTNLDMDERDWLLKWVRRQLKQALARSRTEVKTKLRTVNQILGREALDRPDLVKLMTGGDHV